MNQKILTMRLIFERAALLELLAEPEFAYNLSLRGKCDAEPANDHFLAIFVFEASSQDDGTLCLRPISTTVVGVQRYTTKRLNFQGVYLMANPEHDQIPFETLRAHFRAQAQDVVDRMNARCGPKLRWTKEFVNGAGDLSDPPEFFIDDPDVEDLNALFSLRPEEENSSE